MLTDLRESCSVRNMPDPPQQSGAGFPLTRFLTALSHSPELLDLYHADLTRAMEGWGLNGDQITALQGGKLTDVQAEVDKELGVGKAKVGWWIRVFGGSAEPASAGAEPGVAYSPPPGAQGGLPDWWIRSS